MGHANLALVGDSFALLDDVVALTDIAMSSRDPRRIVPMLVDGLRGVIASVPALPPALLVADAAGYIRRELYRSPRFGYQVLAITWAPGQGSGVHDHAETWGVEAVLRGQLEVVDYRVAGRHKALAELHPADHGSCRPARSSACCHRTICIPAATPATARRQYRCTSTARRSTA